MSVSLDLDDLGSFDGSDYALRVPLSPAPSNLRQTPIGLTVGEISPSSGPLSNGVNLSLDDNSGIGGGRNHVHSVHGVHMHTHENTKVPLLNQSVDRTNSSRPSYHTAHSDGFNMAELFLNKESQHRQSLSQSYAVVKQSLEEASLGGGSVNSMADRRPSADSHSTNNTMREGLAKVSKADEAQLEIDALAAAIDPTPWSEIEQKICTASQQQQNQNVQPHPHLNSYYPYGRHHQLPIPEKTPISPPKDDKSVFGTSHPTPPNASTSTIDPVVFEQALVTAAQLASVRAPSDPKVGNEAQPLHQQQTVKTIPPTVSNPITSVPNPIMVQKATATTSTNIHKDTKAQSAIHASTSKEYASEISDPVNVSSHVSDRISRAPSQAPAQHHQRQRATNNKPQHAATHSKFRASVVAAASKKAQYGFGGNHMVQSVPAPPPTASTKSQDTTSQITNRRNSPSPSLPALSSEASINNSGAAYERKKQRAKDARVKLNESIERLSIAMSLAGSQSKHRYNLLSGRIMNTEQRPKSLKISDECVKLAEQAKKWDRPSFVGTAAQLVQTLNSQCESLARELICLQERLQTTGNKGSSAQPLPFTGPAPSHPNQLNGTMNHKRPHPHPHSQYDAKESPAKRVKSESSIVGSSMTTDDNVPLSNERIIFGQVAKMLDPVSLTRCPIVSKKWHKMGVFDDSDIWLHLAVKRFGYHNVRQWTEKLEDDDNQNQLSKKSVYRAMNAANVMPHIKHQGSFINLGNAKIPGRVHGWVFMIERSNGETLRSVKRHPNNPSACGGGSYQSRPVVELLMVIQNTGMAKTPIVIKDQQFSVDVSTRRSGGELPEVDWDDRFSKSVKHLDGSSFEKKVGLSSLDAAEEELCRLSLFDSAILTFHVDAKGCSTTAKFRQRSNFMKLLVSLEGTTMPMVIPFMKDASSGQVHR